MLTIAGALVSSRQKPGEASKFIINKTLWNTEEEEDTINIDLTPGRKAVDCVRETGEKNFM